MNNITYDTGEQVEDIHHLVTGFWSLDNALACGYPRSPGGPTNAIWEIFGFQGSGKSSFCYLLGALACKNKTIVIAEIEPFSPSVMQNVLTHAGFTGKVNVIQRDNHEDIIEQFMIQMQNEEVGACIYDSIGATLAMAEIEGDVEEAVMGRRAKLINKMAKRALKMQRFRKSPLLTLATNHIHQIIGGRGILTPGGVVLGYASRVRIWLMEGEHFDDGSWIVKGKVEKNSWGLPDGKFNLFYLKDQGFHPGLSAVTDCITLGLAKKEKTITMDDVAYGYMIRLIRKAHDGETATFEPFVEKLKQYKEELR